MTAVTVLLSVLLLILNIANAVSTSHQSQRLLNALVNIQTKQPIPVFGGFLQNPVDENVQMSSVYFTVRTDEFFNLVFVDVSRIASVSKQDAEKIALTVLKNGSAQGKIQGFRYASSRSGRGYGMDYVFLDISQDIASVIRVMFFSFLASAVCWGFMLLLVSVLSKRAIKPIAENMEKQKKFVTDAGHEIKTPLAIILANTEALELYSGETKWSRNIRTQTERLSSLTQNLLMLAKNEDSSVHIEKERVSLSALADETAGSFCESAQLRNIIIDVYCKSVIWVRGNAEELRNLFFLLADNGVKYACEGSILTIAVEKKGGMATVVFSNQCEALPECTPEKLFDRFYRGDSARTQKSGGFGIGLSSALSIASSHGGTVSAQYHDRNFISFTVSLPALNE